MKHPFMLWPLILFILFLGLGGLYGGIAMLINPNTGGPLQLTEILPLLPVSDFILPDLFLLFVMGLAPLLLIYGLIVHPNWKWTKVLSHWSGHHWAWTGTLVLGIILAIWLFVQGLLIGFKWPIQYITAIDGFLIILIMLLPGVRRFYAK